eukprot:m.9538 g.9538  ORF g.9538 m.9538 type:complete len:100 (+) comp4079_c0_seq2:94-393(+)
MSEGQACKTLCSTCGVNWTLNIFTEGCLECGGGDLKIACPICKGSCGSIWTRNVSSSQDMKEAHWDGYCALPPEQQRLAMLKHFQPSEEDLCDALMDMG